MSETPTPAAATPIVAMRNISIEFPGVKALDNVDFRLFPGEVHSLLGENGAGKSTLIKALTGVYQYDSGSVTMAGKPLLTPTPSAAQAAGISTVYQEVNLCANISVAENLLLGHEPRRFATMRWRSMRRRASELLEQMHLDIDPASQLESHSIAIQQLVAIGRALSIDAQVLVLDEPTSSLDASEVEQLFGVVREIKARGVAVLFVSHFLDQVYEITDRMTVLRNGKLVGEYLAKDLPRLELVSKMIGKDLAALEELEHGTTVAAERREELPYLTAVGLGRKGSVEPFDLQTYSGEILGIAGLLGSGRTELARLLFGADRADSGQIDIESKPAKVRNPRQAIGKSIVFSSENRKAEGVIGDLTVRENIVLAVQAERGWLRRIPARQADEIVDKYMEALDIRPRNPGALLANLSGGNQQKVLLARWLATAPKLLILDEPTRGIDVGAKAEIQKLVADLAADGMSVIFISSELEEVLRLSHRIAVMRDRKKVGEMVNEGIDMRDVMELIASGEEAAK